MKKRVARFYRRHIRPHLSPIGQQRLKLIVFAWAYLPILFWGWMPDRFRLLWQFLRIDWNVPHAHRPSEIVMIARAFRALPDGVMVEAGCWNGGSTAKWSLLCQRFGRTLVVYDSFQGVMEHERTPDQYDFAGEYAAPELLVRRNVERYGATAGVSFVPGWFADTLARQPPDAIAIAYIDCDVAEGTQDALMGICRTLQPGGVVFSQDYHITSVRRLLESAVLWQHLNYPQPHISGVVHHTARLTWNTP